MKKSFILQLAIVIVGVFFLTSCGSESSSDSETSSNDVESENSTETSAEASNAKETAVCIWEELSVKASPEDKGKYVTAIYLGEIVEYLGETKVDEASSKKREYMKVKLSDGTEGWVQSSLMQQNVERYVVKNNTKVYKRPDLLTVTEDEFSRMDFVVVLESQSDWYKIKGKPAGETWFKEGWVQPTQLSDLEEDLNVSIMTKRALSIKDKNKREEALNGIIANEAFTESVFIKDVKNMLIPAPERFATGNNQAIMEKFVLGMDLYTPSEANSSIMVGERKLTMMTEGINGILYYHELLKRIDEVVASGTRRVWDDKYAILTDLGSISPVLDRPKVHGEMDYINPDFINWTANNMIPDPESQIAGVSMQTIYTNVYSYFFRMMVRGYYYTTNNLDIEKESQAYLGAFQNEDLFNGPSYIYGKYKNSFIDLDEEQNYVYNNEPISDSYVIGFWLRRNIDGSKDQVWQALRMGMQLYDQNWMEEETNKWN